jgi:hypothetical protein
VSLGNTVLQLFWCYYSHPNSCNTVFPRDMVCLRIIIIIIIIIEMDLSLGGSSFYTNINKTNKNKYT